VDIEATGTELGHTRRTTGATAEYAHVGLSPAAQGRQQPGDDNACMGGMGSWMFIFMQRAMCKRMEVSEHTLMRMPELSLGIVAFSK